MPVSLTPGTCSSLGPPLHPLTLMSTPLPRAGSRLSPLGSQPVLTGPQGEVLIHIAPAHTLSMAPCHLSEKAQARQPRDVATGPDGTSQQPSHLCMHPPTEHTIPPLSIEGSQIAKHIESAQLFFPSSSD